MKTINYVTGNPAKFSEAMTRLKKYKIKPIQIFAEIDEIQHNNEQVALDKAHRAYERLKKPIVVNDASWEIPALQGFPGPYMKHIQEWFDAEDFLRLISAHKDRSVNIIEYIVYKDENATKVIEKRYEGVFAIAARGGDIQPANSIEKVAEFKGRTLAEHHDDGKFVHGFETDDSVWDRFAKWYLAYKNV